MEKLFKQVAANKENKKWDNMISRTDELYKRPTDLRTEFERDYTRIIYSAGYRRLKHKTQVFFSPKNDHICTRIEHVNHVESISYTIANALGLNTSLTKAIATAHDIGHSPFGHQGEYVITQIMQKDIGEKFWHEKNGLNFVDNIELLGDENSNKQNLNLTYAVRDGIISHCGEIDENNIKPRDEYIDLNEFKNPNTFSPYTWEGCIVKVADKIAYMKRDTQDALTLGILDSNIEEAKKVLGAEMNNSNLINDYIYDLIINSTPEKGIGFSKEMFEKMKLLKEFNYKNIYKAKEMEPSNRYFNLVINQIYEVLKGEYDGKNTINNLEKLKKHYPNFIQNFIEWIEKFWNIRTNEKYKNKILYNMNNEKDYYRAILDYISGMTDNYAIETYNEIISWR